MWMYTRIIDYVFWKTCMKKKPKEEEKNSIQSADLGVIKYVILYTST